MMAIEPSCTALWLTASRKCHYGRFRNGHLPELAGGEKLEPIHVMKHFSPQVELMRLVARQFEWELSGLGADRYLKNLLWRAIRRLPGRLRAPVRKMKDGDMTLPYRAVLPGFPRPVVS